MIDTTTGGGSSASVKGPPFTILLADKNNKELDPATEPSAQEARELVFDVHINDTHEPPTPELMGYYRELAKIQHSLQTLYPDASPANEGKFRPYFVRLFYLAQLILEGDVYKDDNGARKVGQRLSSEAAKAEIAAMVSDLIDDEAPRIKNRHLKELGWKTILYSVAFLGTYVLLRLTVDHPDGFARFLYRLNIDPIGAANFMLLWVGTFVGVCLSYAIRTHTFSLTDLTKTDNDYLAPEIRLAFAGALATLLTLVSLAGLGDVDIGGQHLSNVTSKPVVAFVLGAILGISEKTLPGTIQKRASDLVGRAAA